MFQILKDIFESDIGKYLAFKWGTACYFLYGLDRFSTDIDLDIIDDVSVDVELEQILRQYGTLKKWNKTVLSYGDDDINIKIDVSRKVWKSNHYEIVNFYGTDICVQDKGTIFANKLVAFTERSANRDIYDIWFFFKSTFPINQALIQERTGNDAREFLKDVKQKLLKLGKNYNILDWLGEVLTDKQKYFVKTALVAELIAMLSLKIDF